MRRPRMLLDMVADVALQLADAPQRAAFVTVEEDKPTGGITGGGGYGPYFGSIPDFGRSERWRAILRRAAGFARGEGGT